MFDWHLTWQDPVALGLAMAALLAVWRLRGTPAQSGGCDKCAPSSPTPGAGQVSLKHLALSRGPTNPKD